MATLKMVKVAILGHREIKDKLLTHLQSQEILELIAADALAGELALKRDDLPADQEPAMNELAAALNFLEKVEDRKKSFLESFAPTRQLVGEEELRDSYSNFDWPGIIAQVKDLESELANQHNLISRFKSDIELLAPWLALDVALDRLACTRRSCVLPGRLKTRDLESFKAGLTALSPRIDIQLIHASRSDSYLMLFYMLDEEEKVMAYLSRSEFKKVILPVSERTVAEEIEHLKRQIGEAADTITEQTAQARSLLVHMNRLMQAYDHLHILRAQKEARAKLLRTGSAFVLTGWIKEQDLLHLKSGLKRHFKASEVLRVEPIAGEVPPALIENPRVFKPFEVITRIFGLPSPGELDPTVPLSFFYMLFFALCLSDAGYGLILMAAAYYLLKKLQLTEGGRNLLILLFWGGFFTILAGVVTGSYFSIDLKFLPPLLRRAQLIDPIKNPLNVLMLSLLLGVIQNLAGLLLGWYTKFKNQEYLAGLFDFGFWIYFLLALVGFAITRYLNLPPAQLFTYLALSGALLLIATQGRNEPTILKKIISGVLSLYRTTSFLGDTLSYSRLLALMMTTSIIGMVVNILADLTKNSIPLLGYVIMILILLIGHTFNLVVSVLGAFIHSMRLQLVEFFGKFYEGGGRVFRPFRRDTKYVLLR